MTASELTSRKTILMCTGQTADGAAPALEPDAPLSQSQRDLRELQVARKALVKDKTQPMNRLQTLILAFTLKQAKARLTLILRQLSDIEAKINASIAQDDATAHKRQILTSIPGIGRYYRSHPDLDAPKPAP
jgi:transposase